MSAIQPSRPPLQPIQKRRVIPRPKRHLRQRSYQVMALESTAKIAVNLVVTAVAASALSQLLPYHWLQQDKLREINTEVKLMEEHVNGLQVEFSRNFDPQQTKSIMQQEGFRFPPNQRRVVLMDKNRLQDEQTSSP
ncbi:hypothetical protein [Nostoc sp. UHCC 0252]|uniref:slr1601 family putative cell division protein n=1 Tax=Nostoc sp. UHCC 0252 TaxID=3110241 RepID=UPI002B1F0CC1|nr:hypothetical protein [Nostoc sp. UHCC 0252]MEA5605380.1 hypothetical protein [Nostoc sp. UHCC 0252]